jgi:hypothetical protein
MNAAAYLVYKSQYLYLSCHGGAVIIGVAGTVQQSKEKGAQQHRFTNSDAVDRSERRVATGAISLENGGQIVIVPLNRTA